MNCIPIYTLVPAVLAGVIAGAVWAILHHAAEIHVGKMILRTGRVDNWAQTPPRSQT